MFSVFKFLAVGFCVSLSFGKPQGIKHEIAKRWAYIENGDPQMRSIHTDCKEIVNEYSDGDLPFYEYTAKMKKCMDRQQRTNIPNYEDSDFFTPTFKTQDGGNKRYETPKVQEQQQQQQQQQTNQFESYASDNLYQNQNSYGTANQRADIVSPQAPTYEAPQYEAPQYQAPQYETPQAQAFPAPNTDYYQQPQQDSGLTARNNMPSYQGANEQRPTMYSNDIVKKDKIPKPHVTY